MDGNRLQRLVARGYEIAGRKIGLLHEIYRPFEANDPLALLTLMGTTPAAFDTTSSFEFDGSNVYGKAVLQGVVDPYAVRVGDYLYALDKNMHGEVADGRKVFIAALDHLQPPLCVDCNDSVSVYRPHSEGGLGLVPYSGSTQASEKTVLKDWPVSILSGGSGEGSNPHLPGDAKFPGWTILMPALPGTEIKFSDILVARDGRRFLISGAELSRLGWRITARLATT